MLALVFTISSGCANQGNTEQVTGTHIVSQTSMPIKTDTQVVIDTPLVLPSHTPTFEPATTTPAPVITMTDSDREMLVQEFLKPSEDCELPCIWGIISGETSWREVENRLHNAEVQSIISVLLENGDILHGTEAFNLQDKRHVINNFSFVERDGIVTMIHLESEGYANPEYFQKQWREYSPSQIMYTYGKPSRVWLKTREKTMGDRHGYGLWLAYDDYGFIIQYNGFLEEEDKILHICPRFEDGMDIMWQQIHIRSLNDGSDILENMGGLVSSEPQAGKKSIKVATGLSVDEFYELFVQDQSPACFDTPAEIWR